MINNYTSTHFSIRLSLIREYRPKNKTSKDDIFGMDEDDKKSQEIDMMEGISDVNLFRNNNDSFDTIFNKELDLDIGIFLSIYIPL